MNFIDSSVLIAAMVSSETFHSACKSLITNRQSAMYGHGLAETFSTLTGGRKGFRLAITTAVEILVEDFAPCLHLTTLTPVEALRAMRDCQLRGVQGGAIYDYLHLIAARKGKAKRFYTLNVTNFLAIHRTGDPEIVHP